MKSDKQRDDKIIEKIMQILNDHRRGDPYDPYLGHPYLSPYQLAVEFQHRYPEDARWLGLPMGDPESETEGSLSALILAELVILHSAPGSLEMLVRKRSQNGGSVSTKRQILFRLGEVQ